MKLRYFPYSGSFVLDEPLRNKGYRKLVVDNYIVFHLVNELERQVVKMRILYGAANYQNILNCATAPVGMGYAFEPKGSEERLLDLLRFAPKP